LTSLCVDSVCTGGSLSIGNSSSRSGGYTIVTRSHEIPCLVIKDLVHEAKAKAKAKDMKIFKAKAKAKTLSSKAKAKTFMKCPGRSLRPRSGLEDNKTEKY